jgi:hypothetical protein
MLAIVVHKREKLYRNDSSGSGEMGRSDGVVEWCGGFGWMYEMDGVVGVSIKLACMDGPIGRIL